MQVPTSIDIIQECNGNLEAPEIRVWCHPHYIGKDEPDYYEVFATFPEALGFIDGHKDAEDVPLIAFRGYEFNIFAVELYVQSAESKFPEVVDGCL